ncbi:hypothetical protein BKA61DRAFT_568028 [Leptodontidium sp. MPI-SDFR-AT-0119]|nr:hypothetical protein BKA61DRAFT_568028 [Leptodontidium sp. MPI-SDFR-AT-0119]
MPSNKALCFLLAVMVHYEAMTQRVFCNGNHTLEESFINTLWTTAKLLVVSVLVSRMDDGAEGTSDKFSRDRALLSVKRAIGEEEVDEDVKEWLLQAFAAIDAEKKLSLMDELKGSFVVRGANSLWNFVVMIAVTTCRWVTQSRAAMGVVRVYRWAFTSSEVAVRNHKLAGMGATFEKLYEELDTAEVREDPVTAQMEIEFERLDSELVKMETSKEAARGVARATQTAVLNGENGNDFSDSMGSNPWSMPSSADEHEKAMSPIEAAAALLSLNPQPPQKKEGESEESAEAKTKTPTWMSLARERRKRDEAMQTRVEMRLKQLKQKRADMIRWADLNSRQMTQINDQACGPGGYFGYISIPEMAAVGRARVESDLHSFKRRGFNLLDATLKDSRAEKEKESERSIDTIDEHREKHIVLESEPVQFKLDIGNDDREDGVEREWEAAEKEEADGEWVDCAEFLDI